MKRAARAVMVMVMALSGCFGARNARTAIGQTLAGFGGGALAMSGLIGLGAVLPCGTGPNSREIDCEAEQANARHTALTTAIVGGVLLGIGLPLMITGRSNARAEEQAQRQREYDDYAKRASAAARARGDAFELTRLAAQAARNGDCAHVSTLSLRIRQLDENVHQSTFVHEPSIQSCIPPPPPPRDRIKDRERAFAITKTASKAARSGQCTDALALEAEVRELDTNVHDAWFVRDDAIKLCLQPPVPSEAP